MDLLVAMETPLRTVDQAVEIRKAVDFLFPADLLVRTPQQIGEALYATPSLPELASLLDGLRFLTSFAVEICSPGTFAQRQDAERCWQAALHACNLTREKLGVA